MRNTLAYLALTTILLGCSHTQTEPAPLELRHHRADQAKDIATIHLSTILVWSWDDVTTAIQPEFSIDVNVTGPAIVATSQADEQYQRNSDITFGLSIGEPAGTTPSSVSQGGTVVSSGNSKAPKAGSSDSTANSADSGSGSAVNGGAGSSAQKNVSSGQSSTQSSGNGSASQNSKNAKATAGQQTLALSDAMTRLQATNALYQEAGLLNNFTKGLIQRPGYVPFIIRSQLTVLPKYRQEPYDLFVSLKVEPKVPPKTDLDQPAIVVVPLLVTDSIEAVQISDLSQLAQQIQLGLSAGISMEKITAQTRQSINQLSSSLSYRPNSLFAIGKSDVNELLVRMGANRFGNDYELEPLAHSISFVALINRKLLEKEGAEGAEFPLKITATPTYRDALIDDPDATKNDVVGGPITDSFVLLINPYAYRTGDQTFDWFCPADDSVVVVNDSATAATATVRGLLPWGNRQAYGDISGNLKDGRSVRFLSSLARQKDDGTMVLSWDSLSTAIPQSQWPRKWDFYLEARRLKTDANYKPDDPVSSCHMQVIVAETKSSNKNRSAKPPGAGKPAGSAKTSESAKPLPNQTQGSPTAAATPRTNQSSGPRRPNHKQTVPRQAAPSQPVS
jgi:hypothetical protein